MTSKRILTISDWKNKNVLNEENSLEQDVISPENQVEIDKVITFARDMGLPKSQTLDYVKTIFTDPSKAPDEISVQLVKDYLGDITSGLDSIPEGEWPSESDFLGVVEMIKLASPKDWVIFKLNETRIAKFVEENKYDYIFNSKGFIYVSDITSIKESFSNNLDKERAKIVYNKVKWIKDIVK